MSDELNEPEPIQTAMISYSGKEGEPWDRGCKIQFENLTRAELGQLLHTLKHGCGWIRFHEGRLEVVERFEEIPRPESDPAMVGFWTPSPDSSKQCSLVLFDFSEVHDYNYPGILIQHLCGYNYSEEKYAAEVQRLESYGFQCCRSRRGDGQFWEVWWLPSLLSARGKLKSALETHLACSYCGSGSIASWNFRDPVEEGGEIRCMSCVSLNPHAVKIERADGTKEQLNRAVEFLGRTASFGTLDIVCQRLAMVME